MAIPWNGIGTSHGRGFHDMLLWVGLGIPPNGSSWGSPNGALCVAHGDHSQWPFHGMALVHPLDLPIEACHGIPSHEKSECHSMGWPLVDPHEKNLEASHDIPRGGGRPKAIPWNGYWL